MKCVLVFAHPSPDSLCATVKERIAHYLETRGLHVTVHDLYKDRFIPIVSLEEWHAFKQGITLPAHDNKYQDDLTSADHLILVFPTWWYGLPAILKGYFDRMWGPQVAFEVRNGMLVPAALGGIKSVVIVTTYGSPWWWIRIGMREPTRRTLTTGLRAILNPRCRFYWVACYGLDSPNSVKTIRRFFNAIETTLGRLI